MSEGIVMEACGEGARDDLMGRGIGMKGADGDRREGDRDSEGCTDDRRPMHEVLQTVETFHAGRPRRA